MASEHTAGPENPYASALDGLEIDDPVQAFFDFCRERERIRIRRESGESGPWSDDPIFQQGRFLNVFREDDRGTKSILRFVEPVAQDFEALVHAVFFARWCNRDSTIDQLDYADLCSPLALRSRFNQLAIQPWCNVTAYPVGPIRWAGKTHPRLDAAVELFHAIRGDLAALIKGADRDVVRATQAINDHFGMDNDFPIFMAVMDVAWFRPDLIDPASHVPTGIGAAPYLDRLQHHLGLADHHQACEAMIALQAEHWPDAKRAFQPIDIEYLSCECRKYFSYRNGTKQFEGKNRFLPGQDAQFVFDIDGAEQETIQTQIHVIAGGPCSGKTTLLRELKARGYRVEDETSEVLLKEGVANGQDAEVLRADPVQWQRDVLEKDHSLFDGLPVDELIFTDTSFIEDLVFSRRAGIQMGPNVHRWLKNKRYRRVFFLEPLATYESNAVRMESQALAEQIGRDIQQEYNEFGYGLIRVPACSLAERLDIILQHLDG